MMQTGKPNGMVNRRRAVLIGAALVGFPVMAVGQTNGEAASPEGVVRRLITAMQVGDAAQIRAAFAEGAEQAYGEGSAKTGDAFRAWLETDIITAQGRVNEPEFAVDGDTVVVTGEYRNASGYRSKADFLMGVEAGKIVSWRMRY